MEVDYVQLSRQADYAVRVALDLAVYDEGRIKEIAERQSVPEPYLAKVVQSLARAGLVHTARGPRGGVRLAQDPNALTLRQVVEAAQGPFALTQCLAWADDCPQTSHCPARRVWGRMQENMVSELENVTLAKMADELEEARQKEG
jgi:Rrf2 family protein